MLYLCVFVEIMSQAVEAVMATFKPVVEDHQFGCWSIKATKCHILASEGSERQKYTHSLSHYTASYM